MAGLIPTKMIVRRDRLTTCRVLDRSEPDEPSCWRSVLWRFLSMFRNAIPHYIGFVVRSPLDNPNVVPSCHFHV